MKLVHLFLTAFLLSIMSFSVSAQSHETTLKDFIQSLEKKHAVTFSYDSDLLEGVPFSLSQDTSGYDLKKKLEYVINKTAFNLRFVNDSVIIMTPKQAGTNYKLEGTIIDKATGEALPGCTISNTNKSFSTVSDETGNYSGYIHYSAKDTLVFSYISYRPVFVPLSSFNSNKAVKVSMEESITEIEGVTVTAYMSEGIKFNRLDNSIQIKPKDLALLPGQTDADLLLSLDALPGINSPDSKAGNLNVRGSSADQTLITFDNIPIYHKGHYFGTLSPFNPKVVENLNVSRSSFTADKGGRAGGMIDIRTKQSVPDSALSGVAISTIDGSAYTNIPIIKKKLGVLVAGRTSYPNGWMSPKLHTISDFVFQATDINRAQTNPDYHLDLFKYNFYDLNAKMIAKPSDKHTISVSFLKIFNQLNAKINNIDRKTFTYDSIGFNNWGLSGQWSGKWSKRINSSFTVTKSYFKQEQIVDTRSAQLDTITGKITFENSIDDLDINAETNFLGKRKNFLKIGYDVHFHNFIYEHKKFVPSAVLSNFSHSNKGHIHSVYTSYNLTGHKRLKTSIGLRGNYYSITNGYNIEPRLTVNYLLSNTITVKSSAGIQKQFVTQVAGLSIETFGGLENMVWIMADGRGIPVLQSKQIMGGAMYEKNNWVIDVEGYYKHIDDITVININDFTSTNPFFNGQSYTAGMDVLLRKGWKKIDAWASYTLSKSMMDIDSIQSTPFPSLSDQRHILDVVGTYKWRKWKFSAGWKYRTGMASIIGIRTRLLHGAPQQSNPSAGPPPPGGKPTNPEFYEDKEGNPFYEDRYPAFHQLDVSFIYSFPSKQKKWNGSIGLSLANVYNRKNIIEQQHIRVGPPGPSQYMQLVSRYSIGFAPNLFVSLNF